MAITPAEARLVRVLRLQHGVAARTQVPGFGVPLSTVDGRLRSGRYVAVYPGVFAEAGAPLTWMSRALAAVLWAGGDAALARASAAHLHGLPARVGPVHLLVADRTFRTPSGIVVHRSRTVGPAQITRRERIPVTTVPRTICDVAGDVDAVRLRRLVAAAAREGMVDATSLRAALSIAGRVPGAGRVRALADELSPLDAQARSPLESMFLAVVRRSGLEPTAMNHPVRDRSGRRRYLDAVWLPERLPVELDSTTHHTLVLDVNDDADREALVVGVDGWRQPLRFTWGDVDDRPDVVVARLRRRLARIRSTGSVC